MTLAHYMCTHCGGWQEYFATPPSCFVCSDVRNALPEDGYTFQTEPELRARGLETHWRYVAPTIVQLWTTPQLGIGSCGYVVLREEGNVGFEAASFYTDAALSFLESMGGLRTLSCSHPHGMGALWQLQRAFDPEVVVHRDAVRFTKAFEVDVTFDDTWTLAEGCTLHHVGGHYEGQAVLHAERERALFCGDALKFEHGAHGSLVGLSCHKAFHKRIPLSHEELRTHRHVIGALAFEQAFSPFDHGPGVSTADAVHLYDTQLARFRPTTSMIPFDPPRTA